MVYLVLFCVSVLLCGLRTANGVPVPCAWPVTCREEEQRRAQFGESTELTRGKLSSSALDPGNVPDVEASGASQPRPT